MLKLRRDIIAAVLAQRLRSIIVDAEEIREISDNPSLSQATCDEIAVKVTERANRLAIQLLATTRY